MTNARTTFWNHIEASRSEENAAERVERLRDRLAGLEPAEIVTFDRELAQVLAESYRQDLWGAAYIVCGGCSDDGFEYFRGWLILQGKDVYESALQDPDSLVGVVGDSPEDCEVEEVLYVARDAYEEATGSELPSEDRPAYPEIALDVDFDDDDAMRALYPKLCARFFD